MSKAVGVGMVRGSAVKRLRPVGSTSVRPRAGAPDGPAVTWRPSSAAISAARSASALSPADRLVVRLGAAIDVQPVLDGEILEVAEPGVDAAQRLVRRVSRRRRRLRAASPVFAAVSTISFASRSRRRRSSPSACAYSSTSRSSFCLFSSRPAAASGGGRWPSVTAAMRRLACAASPGLVTMKG